MIQDIHLLPLENTSFDLINSHSPQNDAGEITKTGKVFQKVISKNLRSCTLERGAINVGRNLKRLRSEKGRIILYITLLICAVPCTPLLITFPIPFFIFAGAPVVPTLVLSALVATGILLATILIGGPGCEHLFICLSKIKKEIKVLKFKENFGNNTIGKTQTILLLESNKNKELKKIVKKHPWRISSFFDEKQGYKKCVDGLAENMRNYKVVKDAYDYYYKMHVKNGVIVS